MLASIDATLTGVQLKLLLDGITLNSALCLQRQLETSKQCSIIQIYLLSTAAHIPKDHAVY